MSKALSTDLRERVVKAYNNDPNAGYARIAERFGVSKNSVRRWVKQYRETGSLDPLPLSGGNPTQKLFDEHEEAVKVWLEENPAMLQQEIAAKLSEDFDVEVQQPAISKLLKRLEG